MSSDGGVVRIPVTELNRLLTCKLCLGYFQDAHTIPECMHTFCRSCISSYFDRYNDGRTIPCPNCGTNIGFYHIATTRIIFDRNIQSIVDKIFPPDISDSRLIQQQLQQQTSAPLSDMHVEDEVDFTVKALPDETCDESLRLPTIPKPSFKGKWDISIKKVQKFVVSRLDKDLQEVLGNSKNGLEILYDGRVLDGKTELSMFRSTISQLPTTRGTHAATEEDINNNQSGYNNGPTLVLHYRRKEGK